MEELNRYLQDVGSSSRKVATLLHTTLLIKLSTAFLHSLSTIVSVASTMSNLERSHVYMDSLRSLLL